MRFRVRIDPGERRGPASDVLLDRFAHNRSASTVQYDGPDHRFLKDLAPSPVALDLLRLDSAIFCADKIAERKSTADHWTRELEMSIPVSDADLWTTAVPLIEDTLRFLSGDRWSLSFTAARTAQYQQEESHETTEPLGADAVSLFSGGLDSLAGVIELLEAGRALVLVGHHDSSLTDHTQAELFNGLAAHYDATRLTQRRLLLRPAARDVRQVRQLPGGEGENSTRTRSLLFLSAGVAVANAVGSRTPLFLPENGFIGVNVPLTAARVGSLSTRTTHPYFLARMSELLSTVGLDHPLENPYRLATKGEALERGPRRDLLGDLAPASISCSHPEAARWRPGARMGNCGYCYPCMIRRASLHRIGLDRVDEYDVDALTCTDLLTRTDREMGRDLRALLASLGQPARTIDVLRNGRIPAGETRAFFDVYMRGRDELRVWLTDGGSQEILARLG